MKRPVRRYTPRRAPKPGKADTHYLEWRLRCLRDSAEGPTYFLAADNPLYEAAEAAVAALDAADDPRHPIAKRVATRENLLAEMGLLDRAERLARHLLRGRAGWARPDDFSRSGPHAVEPAVPVR